MMSPAKRRSTNKRKRDSSTLDPPNPKRRRETKSTIDTEGSNEQEQSQSSQESWDPEREYSVKEILKETPKKYLIAWEGIDTKTGRTYEPTWEPKEFANALAIEDWERKKNEKKERKAAQQAEKKAKVAATKPPVRRRAARVIDSSSLPATPYRPAPSGPFVEEDRSEHSAVDTSPPLPVQTRPAYHPFVQITQKSDFDPDDYERFSQLPPTQSQISSSPQQATPKDTIGPTNTSEPSPAPTPLQPERVIPDSQSQPEEANKVPSREATPDGNREQSVNGEEPAQEALGTVPTDAAIHTPRSSSPHPVPQIDGTAQSSVIVPGIVETLNIIVENFTQTSTPSPSPKPVVEANSGNNASATDPEVVIQETPQEDRVERRDFAFALQTETVGKPRSTDEKQGEQIQSSLSEDQETLRPSPTQEQEQERDSNQTAAQSGTNLPQETTQVSAPEEDQQAQLPTSNEQDTPEQIQDPAEEVRPQRSESSLEATKQLGITEHSAEDERTSNQEDTPGQAQQETSDEAPPGGREASTLDAARPSEPKQPSVEPVTSTQEHNVSDGSEQKQADASLQEPTEAGVTDPSFPEQEGQVESVEPIVQPELHVPQSTIEVESLKERTQTSDHQNQSVSPTKSTASYFQEGQIVPLENFSSASSVQDDTTSVRATTEVPIPSPKEIVQVPASNNESDIARSPDKLPSTPVSQLPPLSNSLRDKESSSPIPRPPSHSLNTLDTRVLPRLRLSASRSPYRVVGQMEPLPPGLSLTERQDRRREWYRKHYQSEKEAQMRTTASPSHSGTRSPSTIPDQAPSQQPAPPSLRTTALTNAAQEVSASISTVAPATPLANKPVEVEDAESFLLDGPELDADEHIVPLPMVGRQKSQYGRVLKASEDLIKSFTTSTSTGSEELKEVVALLERLKAVENHDDLLNHEASSQKANAEELSNWAIDNSMKFRFLSELFEVLKEREFHVAILAKPGQLLNIVEDFIKGQHLHYDYPSAGRRSSSLSVFGRLFVTLLPTFGDASSPVIRPPDVIICLDSTADSKRARKAFGSHLTDSGRTVPIINLRIIKASEHIDQCITHTMDATERLRTFITCIAQLRIEAGRLPAHSPDVKELAVELARFLIPTIGGAGGEDEGSLEWPLSPIGGIKDSVVFESQSTSTSGSRSETPVHEPSSAQKRPLDVERLDPSKKMRMTPQPTASADDAETTKISDSVGNATQQDGLKRLEQEGETLRKRLAAVESQLQVTVGQNKELHASMENRQGEHERVMRALLDAQNERDEAKRRSEYLIKQNDMLQERSTKKDADVAELRDRLEAERDANLKSTDTNIAELARLREALKEAEVGRDKAEKSAKSKEADLEFFRGRYQDASNQATSLAERTEELEAELVKYKKQASGEVAKLKQMGIDNHHAGLERRVKNLEQQVESRERVIKQKDEELKVLKMSKGLAMGTRAASVPRSPRVGAGSRGASPLPDRHIHKLRHG